jgi:hypothetical protein
MWFVYLHPQGNGIIQICALYHTRKEMESFRYMFVCDFYILDVNIVFLFFGFFFRIKLAKLENIFITHKSWDNIGGLYGK